MNRPNRHIPRICPTCGAPQGGNEASCWSCGTPWVASTPAKVGVTPPAA